LRGLVDLYILRLLTTVETSAAAREPKHPTEVIPIRPIDKVNA
jgi:hypothetical protein